MALLQTCTYARITHTLRLAYAAHQVRRLMTGVRTSPSGLLDGWRATLLNELHRLLVYAVQSKPRTGPTGLFKVLDWTGPTV